MLEEIESGNHTRIAAMVYQSQGWDLEGHLAWRSGEVCEFINLIFQEFSLVPPNESQLYPLYAKFCVGWSNQLATLNCFCLADAVLRVVFHTEIVTLGENAPDSEVPSGRISWTESLPGFSVQPEASGQPSGASTLRRLGSCEASVRPVSWQPQRVASVPELALPGGVFGASRATPGRLSSGAAASTGYGSTGQFSPTGTSARSPSPVSGSRLVSATSAQQAPVTTASGLEQFPTIGLNPHILQYAAYVATSQAANFARSTAPQAIPAPSLFAANALA